MERGPDRPEPGVDRPTVAAVGEFAVIAQLRRAHPRPDLVVVGPGDDAAVLRAGDGPTVLSTDMLVEDRHFRLDWSHPEAVGRKAIAQNAADVEAMGGTATAFVAAIGAPAHTPADRLTELADGMAAEAARFGAGVVGGDLVDAPLWVVSVTALGDLGSRAPVTLAGARPGDLLAMSGGLGLSAAGLALWLEDIGDDEPEAPALPGAWTRAALRRRHLVPEVPYGAGRIAAEHGATAMTDVSDGLIADLGHLARASGVTVDVSRAGLRADHDAVAGAAAATGADPWQQVFAGGEDHALVATFGPGGPPPGWRVIGRVADGPAAVLVDGDRWTGPAGWQSF